MNALQKALPPSRKNFVVRLIFANGRRVIRRSRAGPRQLLTPAGVDRALDQFAAAILVEFPNREFRLVPLRDGNFNFVEVETAGRQTA